MYVPFNQNHELPRDYDLEGACYPNEVHFRSPRTHGQGLVHKQRFQNLSNAPSIPQGDTLVVDVISDLSEDVDVNHTLKTPRPPPNLAQIQKHTPPSLQIQNDRLQDFVHRDITDQSNFLTLSIIHCLFFLYLHLP